MSGISYRLEGAEEALATLARAAAAADRPRELYDNIGAALVVSSQERFDTGTGPDGNPWPLSIRAMMQGGRTMIDTSRLRNSQTHEASDTGVEIGTNDIRAPILHEGGTITAKTSRGLRFRIAGQWITKQSVTIPARPWLGLDGDDETEIVRLSEVWLAKATGAEGGGNAP